MKVAKADNNDLDSTHAFFMACEIALERDKFSLQASEDNWEDLDDDDPDTALILKLKNQLEADEGKVDNRVLMFEFLQHKFAAASANWRRVYYAASILIDNVCDPTEDHLAFYPGFELKHVVSEQ